MRHTKSKSIYLFKAVVVDINGRELKEYHLYSIANDPVNVENYVLKCLWNFPRGYAAKVTRETEEDLKNLDQYTEIYNADRQWVYKTELAGKIINE